jgi:hypothetical protein
MTISGWGILLIFGADQAVAQTLASYPPFGLATMTVLNIAAYLMLGIYNSATHSQLIMNCVNLYRSMP